MEVLVAVSIITSSILAIVGVYSTFLKQTFINTPAIQAAYLSEEGVEALKSMRDFGWTTNIASLTVGTTYRPYFNSALSRWQATTSTSTAMVDNTFDRTFVLATAYRDGSDNLASSGSSDQNSRKVTVTVAWKGTNGTSTKTLMTYISNLFDN